MLSKNTTFILGAGASADFGFPTGGELINNLTDILYFRGNLSLRAEGDEYLLHYFRKKRDHTNRYLQASHAIRDALPHNLSIDNFLKDRNDDLFDEIAKLAVTRIIKEAEKILFTNFKDEFKWIRDLITIIKDGYSKEDVKKIFEKVKIITFNYDRSFEFLLSHAVANAYTITIKEALEIVHTINIVHPYGSLGKISEEIEFSKSRKMIDDHFNKDKLPEISGGLKTFSETLADGIQNQIQNAIEYADRLIFLGFGFHKSNLDLLNLDNNLSNKRYEIFYTVYKETNDSIKIIEDRLKQKFPRSLMYNNKGTSGDLLSEHKRRLLDY